jgi:hypothetical protein
VLNRLVTRQDAKMQHRTLALPAPACAGKPRRVPVPPTFPGRSLTEGPAFAGSLRSFSRVQGGA